ncbi:MAG: twin-arginine translocase TatA/TatE family subunit [Nitrospinaceae bacterium]|nr:twin-arginine translocase TatA/TatE family subunit [Nitrospinaceae bacterium]NIR54641.1 twin-arginine translocase TatA/TatE family subunit [Nitrospinaceae bacterium]NIS85058.1 twin-arginine translocase TatA/TatE family subunit [Nitrospinaceae bacterium]NIT81875.1 twin-arginine translocase TatA/TatE family subunit [Nitrospinaceae bacterium]NIU44139.1 twin-arginine translocase TatA/TatE family subunit [Nitrospinaceae bacterium]
MMGIGFPELMIILVIIMIIFGAGKLPEIGSAFGRSIRNFKQSMKEAEEEPLEEASGPKAEASGSSETAAPQSAEASSSGSGSSEAKKKEDELIDEEALEIEKNRISTIRTAHDGLVQQGDVFNDSLKKVPGGRGRDRGVARDVF